MSLSSPLRSFELDETNPQNSLIWNTIYKEGEDFSFGDPTEVKKGRWVYSTVAFRKKALEDMNKGIMPDAWDFNGAAVKEYGKQFFDKSTWYAHVYSYAARLMEYEITNPDYPTKVWQLFLYLLKHWKIPPLTVKINQLEYMREQLREAFDNDIQTTRIIAITFRPGEDYYRPDIPCFQIAQVFPLGGRKVSIRYFFRSHDYAHGINANGYYLNNGFLKEVINPVGGKLVETIFTSAVAHLYNNDFSLIEKSIENTEGY